jgi:hypothetical protein
MNDSEAEYQKAQIELGQAINSLRALAGKDPIPFSVPDPSQKAEPPICSFCGKGSNQVKRVIAGHKANICNECVLLAVDILELDHN